MKEDVKVLPSEWILLFPIYVLCIKLAEARCPRLQGTLWPGLQTTQGPPGRLALLAPPPSVPTGALQPCQGEERFLSVSAHPATGKALSPPRPQAHGESRPLSTGAGTRSLLTPRQVQVPAPRSPHGKPSSPPHPRPGSQRWAGFLTPQRRSPSPLRRRRDGRHGASPPAPAAAPAPSPRALPAAGPAWEKVYRPLPGIFPRRGRDWRPDPGTAGSAAGKASAGGGRGEADPGAACSPFPAANRVGQRGLRTPGTGASSLRGAAPAPAGGRAALRRGHGGPQSGPRPAPPHTFIPAAPLKRPVPVWTRWVGPPPPSSLGKVARSWAVWFLGVGFFFFFGSFSFKFPCPTPSPSPWPGPPGASRAGLGGGGGLAQRCGGWRENAAFPRPCPGPDPAGGPRPRMLQAGQLLRGKFKNGLEPGPAADSPRLRAATAGSIPLRASSSPPPSPHPHPFPRNPPPPPLRGRPRRAGPQPRSSGRAPGPRPARFVEGASSARPGGAGRPGCGVSGRRDAGILLGCRRQGLGRALGAAPWAPGLGSRRAPSSLPRGAAWTYLDHWTLPQLAFHKCYADAFMGV